MTGQEQFTTLADGRRLGFQLLGDPAGAPLFFFHGTPGSRLEFSAGDPMAQMPGVRLIAPERPGYGISDPKPNRVLLDWADDVAELADHLKIESFAVAGISGGGPHALACAFGLPDRVTMVLALSSPSPAGFRGAARGMALGNRLGLLLGRHAPWLMRRMIGSYASAFKKNPQRFVEAMARQMPPPDRALLSDDSLRAAFIRDLREAYRQGGEAHAVDGALALTSGDWGFDLRRTAAPVHLWHGERDTLVSLPMARHLASEIPNCSARIVPGAGHLLTEYPAVVEQMRQVLTGVEP